jgi:hypothetical protein
LIYFVTVAPEMLKDAIEKTPRQQKNNKAPAPTSNI